MIVMIIATTKAVKTLTNLDSKPLSYLYHHQQYRLYDFYHYYDFFSNNNNNNNNNKIYIYTFTKIKIFLSGKN